ncbi:MAG: sortase [Bacillota bacterium]
MARIRQRTVKWKYLGNTFLITAVIVALYPLLTDFYAWHQQSQLTATHRQVSLEIASDTDAAEPETTKPQLDPELIWAMLEIPEIRVITPVIKGTSRENLTKAPGWYTESALPGKGNTAIAGHRTMHGGTFRDLSRLGPGDHMLLTYNQHIYRYQVEEIKIIDSNDWSVIQDCGYPALTLTTCTPNNADQRLSVRAKLVTE